MSSAPSASPAAPSAADQGVVRLDDHVGVTDGFGDGDRLAGVGHRLDGVVGDDLAERGVRECLGPGARWW